MNHTPGSWELEELSSGGFSIYGKHCERDRCCLAVGVVPLIGNGRLMVAAPDLLEACEAAMAEFRNFDLGHLIAFDKLDAAINKAKGIQLETTP